MFGLGIMSGILYKNYEKDINRYMKKIEKKMDMLK